MLGDGDRCSFDSDGYYEESLGSETSEPECNVWRGWTWKSPKHLSVNAVQRSSTGMLALSAINTLIYAALECCFCVSCFYFCFNR